MSGSMRKTLLLWLFGLLFMTTQALAQDRTVTGVVTDAETGEALIGVSVLVKGTSTGSVTDIDGKYTIKLSDGATTLVFSYIGYTTVEAVATGSVLDVKLGAGVELEETVVTGLAIAREKRSTSFATQTLGNDDFNKTANDIFGALQSKVAGVRVNTSSGAMGASNRVVLRGETSLTGNNNALIVVNGVPIDNSVTTGLENSSANFVDFGNRGNDINPEDIESINVLKGPAATALYGSRGASGVILITTKSGKSLANQDKKFNVNFTTSATYDRAYNVMTRQEQYGQGYYPVGPVPGENFSWGPAFDGIVRPWTSPINTPNGQSQLVRPYSAVPNQLDMFFRLGSTYRNTLAVEGGSDKFTYYFAYGNTKNEGIFENSFYNRNNFTLNASAKLSKMISSKFSIQYSNISQRGVLGGREFNRPYQSAIQTPANIPINEVKDYNNPYQNLEGFWGSYTPNPYFIMNEEANDNKVDNLLGSAEITFTPLSYLNFTARVGNNFNLSNTFLRSPKFEYTTDVFNPDNIGGSRALGLGSYVEEAQKNNDLTIDVFGNFNKEVVKDLDVSVLAGYSFYDKQFNELSSSTAGGLVIPGFYNLGNSVNQSITNNTSRRNRLIGAYGNVNLGYKRMVYIDYTARNDWSSTLPEGNRGYFYQSGGISFIATELYKNKVLNYLKLRANIGTTGKDATAYQLSSVFTASPEFDDFFSTDYALRFPVIGIDGSTVSGFTQGNRIGNPDLKPELTRTWEVGADVGFFKNDRLFIEYTYYNQLSSNLIVDVQLPGSSGYTVTARNVGEVQNVGHELAVRATPVLVKGFKWDVRMTLGLNKNEVLKVSDQSDELSLNTGNVQVIARKGYPLGTYKAIDYERNPNDPSQIVVNAQGYPIQSTAFQIFGSYQPKYTMGFGTNLSWKGLAFDIQFDVRKGGYFYSGTKELAEFNGSVVTTLINDRQPYLVPNSVQLTEDGEYVENTVGFADPYPYFSNMPESQNLIDASYIKLREAKISYTIPKKAFGRVPIQSLSLSIVGRNLKMWLPKENVFVDPEQNSFGTNGNVQGLEFTTVPSTRNVGFELRLTF